MPKLPDDNSEDAIARRAKMSAETRVEGKHSKSCKHKNTNVSYGLAGGGCGVYEYCEDCGAILSKTQDYD